MSTPTTNERPPIIVCKTPDEIIPVLRYELKLRGMEQTELAERLGVSYVTTNRLLNGKSPLSLDQLYKILALLGIGVALAPPRAPVQDVSDVAKRKPPVTLGVTLQSLFNAGMIKAGDILTSIPGENHVIAEVGLRGDLILEDGSEYSSPSSAAKEVRGGTTVNGWTFWGLDGRSLDSMRKELLAGK